MKRVCIDAGHGGNASGAVGPTGLMEKDVTLIVSLEVGRQLKRHGIEVVYTRTSDKFVSLEDRCRIANKAKCNYFVSIHCNSSTSPQAHGIETWCFAKGDKGEILAKNVQNEMVAFSGLTNRGVKYSGRDLAVIRGTNMPSILIETAFISNPNEEKLLVNVNWRNGMADAIAKGILKTLGIKPIVNKPQNGKDDAKVKNLVIYHGDGDKDSASVLRDFLNCYMVSKAGYEVDKIKADRVIVVGGTWKPNGAILLSGKNRAETASAVCKFIREGK